VTIDRVGGVVLVLLALFTIEESWRLKLPLGNLQNPGPAYMPGLLAVLLLGFAILIVMSGARSQRMATVSWSEWRHAVAILAVCAFMAVGLERLGYRITIFVALAFLLGVVERRSVLATIAFAGVFSAASYYLFATLLRVPLPLSPWNL
jgi:hypothetical protein